MPSSRFVVGDAMPKVDYRTLVDIYVDTCFYLQVLTMLANAGTVQLPTTLMIILIRLVDSSCL
jgi:hypothetical protein